MIVLLLSYIDKDILPGAWPEDALTQTVSLMTLRSIVKEESPTFMTAQEILGTLLGDKVVLKLGRRKEGQGVLEAMDLIEASDPEFDTAILGDIRSMRDQKEVAEYLWRLDKRKEAESTEKSQIEKLTVNIDVDPMLQFFACDHLPEKLRIVSAPFGNLAEDIVKNLPRNPERTVALRKLLEAKDCAVRALLYK